MIFFFVKFFKEKLHANQFVGGKLYANRLSYFKGIEYSNRGDKHEGAILLQPDRTRIKINGRDITGDLAGATEIQMNWTNNLNVFCMYAAHSGDQDTIAVDSLSDFNKMMEIPNDCLKFGSHAVVITNASELMKRVKAAALLENYGVHARLVKYYNRRRFHGGSPEEIEPIFNKRDEYQHQNEYRIAITGVEGNAPLILDIGDISDISIRMNAADINRSLKITYPDAQALETGTI